ncbi:hypothetical protein BU23DRAFT_444977 [Bimuria novae-zelandiae CBS 107.79]|uniref:Uncharacterized protein n=1 Tax=Bimuria novae-zelandiae CBS 107.79 TaxID=1447943 RepID=A0A6A5VSJ7_9PLEO|nr:hypothetical protein BU23DRAFT_444977 [Bimuria novae-zelandiae CBS 107.79]
MKSLTLLATFATASPVYILAKRGEPGDVQTCNEPNWSGNCGWIPLSDHCHINGTPGVQSLGPERNGYCTLYANSNCDGAEVISEMRFPGKENDLPEFGSFKCWKD